MNRLPIQIDLFGIESSTAYVRPYVTVGQLVEDILIEFALDFPFLNQHAPQQYALRTARDGVDLPVDQAIQQIHGRGQLFFQEKVVSVPEAAATVNIPLYLRYRSHVFRICWTPAIIGRPIPGEGRQSRLAVNLEPFSLAVSRRQAEIVENNGRFAIRPLSPNPLLLNGTVLEYSSEPEGSHAYPLADGDKILLQSSGIELVCLQPNVLLNQPNGEQK